MAVFGYSAHPGLGLTVEAFVVSVSLIALPAMTTVFALRAIPDKMHVHDLHATILKLMGLDHIRLVYTHNGRPERPTLNEGTPQPKLAG